MIDAEKADEIVRDFISDVEKILELSVSLSGKYPDIDDALEKCSPILKVKCAGILNAMKGLKND